MSVVSTTLEPAASRRERNTFADVLRSEWTKLRTVRSTYWTLIAATVTSIAIGALACAAYVHHFHEASPAAQRLTIAHGDFDSAGQSLIGLSLGQLVIGVLGVLVVSAEYRTGMMRTALTAVPRRMTVLLAKVACFGGVALVSGQILSFGAYFLGQAVLSNASLGSGIGDPGMARAVVGTGVFIALVGLCGLGLGAMVRHTAGAVSALLGFVLVLSVIVQALPGRWGSAVGKFLPYEIGEQVVSGQRLSQHLSPGVGLAVMAGYAAVFLAVGAALLVRRDA
jgi:hypothetical protein